MTFFVSLFFLMYLDEFDEVGDEERKKSMCFLLEDEKIRRSKREKDERKDENIDFCF